MTRAHSIVELIDALNEGVDTVASYAAKSAGRAKNTLSVHFSNSEVGHLDLSEPHAVAWLSVMRSLHENQMPAYVEVDERTKRITQLLQPKLQPVGDIHPLDQGPDLRVELLNSHALHVLRGKHPQFKAFLELLREAHRKQELLWVTETMDTHEIIDVRSAAQSARQKSSNR